MNISAAISRAALPDTHVVCGIPLRPYGIGHWRLLTRCDISFATEKPEHTLGDLLLAVLICSGTYESFTGSLQADGVGRAITRWQRRLSGGFIGVWKRRFKRRRGKLVTPAEVLGFDFPIECEKFQTYLDEHSGSNEVVNEWSRPQTMFSRENAGKPLNSPELEVIYDALVSELKMSESEALNISLPLARWRLATHAERMGWVVVVTDEMREQQRQANEFSAKIMAGMAREAQGAPA